MGVDKLIKKSLYEAAQKRALSTHALDWEPLKEESLSTIKRTIERIVHKAEKIIYQYSEFSRGIHRSADNFLEIQKIKSENLDTGTLLVAQGQEGAKRELQLKSAQAVEMGLSKKYIKETIMSRLWSPAICMAAGKLVRNASLGFDSDRDDLAFIEELKQRGPEVLRSAIKILYNEEDDYPVTEAVARAIAHTPHQGFFAWNQLRHPLYYEEDESMRMAKDAVSQYLWTNEVLHAAGRITAARSLGLKPSWDDIETTRKVDRVGRLTAIHIATEIRGSQESYRGDISEQMVMSAKIIAERKFDYSDLNETNLGNAIKEKIKQYVWTSNPDYCHAKANLAKYGDYHTAHGDVLLIQHAFKQEELLFEKMIGILKEMDRERLDKVQHPIITWLWGASSKLQVTQKDVSNQLVDTAVKMLKPRGSGLS